MKTDGVVTRRRSLPGLGWLPLACLLVLAAGCGGSSSSAPPPPPPPAPPAPFNTSKNEGLLLGTQVVVNYPTLTAGTTTGLDSFYTGVICGGLDGQDCTTNENNLNTAQFGNFDLAADPIGKNSLGISTITAAKIDYIAINVDQTALQVSGGVLVPNVNPSSLKGLILYFHGTTVDRSAVPSNFTALSNTSNYTDGAMLAATWASQGYVVVMPDYIGLGDDTAHVHPYVTYPQTNAQSGLAMVKAARAYLSHAFDVSGTLPFYLSGYSEGGAYALQAEHMMQNNPLYASALNVTLRKTVPLSGFFDLSGTGLPYLFDNISTTNNNWYSLNPTVSALSKPYLSAYLVLSFSAYSGISPAAILASNFYNCPGSTSACGASNNLDGLYFTAPQTSGYNQTVALLSYALATQTGWSTSANAITPLLTKAYATALQNRDPGNPLYRQVVSADTYQFTPTTPITLASLQEDSVVTRKNSDVAFTYFTQQNPSGPYKEELVTNDNFLVASGLGVDYLSSGLTSGASPVDHLTELPFMSVLILNEFKLAP